jgi:hypothetical protein
MVFGVHPKRRTTRIVNFSKRLDVELHLDQGGVVEEKPLQRVQARVLSAGGYRREAPRPDLPRAQPLRERALEIAHGVRSPRRGSVHRKAALRRGDPPGEDSRAGAFVWATVSGEPDPKKVVKENALAERHAVIARIKEEHPELSIERLCELMGVSRSWYYEHPSLPNRRRERT